MKATFKSPSGGLAARRSALLLLVFCSLWEALADPAAKAYFAMYARSRHTEAQSRFINDPTNPTNAAQLGCACFDAANYATNDAERANLAREGIAACRGSIVVRTNYAPTHYYLAMNLGQLADAEVWSALGLVREMEREFKVAEKLDPGLDYAGPARSLGELYFQAPRLGSIGSRHKAREYLQKAAKLAPDYPENHLNLVEVYLKWDELANARLELKALGAGWVRAQTNLTGDAWAESWSDWTQRRAACEQALAKIPPAKEK